MPAKPNNRGRYGLLRAETVELLAESGTHSYRTWQALAVAVCNAREYRRARAEHRRAAEEWAAIHIPGAPLDGLQLVCLSVEQMRSAMGSTSARAAQDALRTLADAGALVRIREGRKRSPGLYAVGPLPDAGAARDAGGAVDDGEAPPP